jgi:hypothetical protein
VSDTKEDASAYLEPTQLDAVVTVSLTQETASETEVETKEAMDEMVDPETDPLLT